jgi:CubicO group peptidase (beta-lactamase class C family)
MLIRKITDAVILLTLSLLTSCGPVISITNVPAELSSTPLPPDISIRPADGMLMTQIPGGIPSGESQPIDGFWFDQTNVTNSQYLRCADAGNCQISPVCNLSEPIEENSGKMDKSMTCARWSDTKAYCEWAEGRLPTEAEWEYAAQQMGEEFSPWGDIDFGFRCVVPFVRPARYWPTQGWITSSLEEEGMDPGLVAEAIKKMETTFPNLHSLLIVRHGFLVVEEYRTGSRPDISQNIASVNKSFLSALIGIAIAQGAIPSIDQKMMNYFPEYSTTEVDAQAYDVTLEHLLTMTSGFYWPEIEPIAPAYIVDALYSGKPQDTLIRSPIVAAPGTTFNYCTACTHVLSIIIQDSTGVPAQDFAQKFLMDPLGISPDDWSWSRTAFGYNTGGWEFDLTPRDMAKFGYLYLNNGNWEGEQIIPEEWVRESRQTHISLGDSNTPPYQHYGYGYLWLTTNLGGHPAYYALGHGGQYIYILPTMDMVVVVTQETDLHRWGDPYEIIKNYFAAAVMDQ